MRIGIPRETRAGERLVAATPTTVAQLVKLGYDVVIEAGAGAQASFPDAAYREAGASVGDAAEAWSSDVVTCVNAPEPDAIAQLQPGATIVSMMAPAAHPELVDAFAERGVSALALDAVPRISRAQALDVLSTMSNVAGYRAVVEAAESYGGMFTGQVTAAGKTAPAKVFVIGGGVAGLAAIGTAGSLGAQVRAFDVRPEAGEQIESMGAQFVQAQAAQQEVSADGYAQEMTAEQERLTSRTYAEESAKADIIITTALVRGSAPRTITAAMVAAMRPGSVIVDLAASGGGNCELTVPGSKIVTDNGVTIIGYTDLTSRLPKHTSQLFGTNIVNLMKLLTPNADGQVVLDMEDVVQRGMTVTLAGEILWPPPPVQVSAAPAAATVAVPVVDPAVQAQQDKEAAHRKGQRQLVGYGLGAVLLGLAITFSPAAFAGNFTVFVLAVFVGYYVISKVSHSLHTPLMAQTNAISGIILVGALLQIGSDNWWVTALAFIAATVASINIFGGFLVAYRMISMFRKDA
ncbi:NAD(P) transhydrogenase subunit alpha [Sanguibacter gelidistatuariae]|uniref:proton-translocating NAD(P)(+) transhydrogenase n=1 Tax=Sanguibacter gelidistatuariae TaxID=1814289 RepID=A0A1G6QFJ0_9MICO|nr:Re/Si-specific NAD(P)(+) transhydrogenase subunit alpha [Sanguibacter gelidistatuariae]SDC90456.1 NAD(P) transhydrogenase subunit alpha [Sanguibacter gelidistatuariae]